MPYIIPTPVRHAIRRAIRRGGVFHAVEREWECYALLVASPTDKHRRPIFRTADFERMAAVIAYIPEARKQMDALQRKPALSEGLPSLNRSTRVSEFRG